MLVIKNYIYPQYKKRMKLISRLTRYLNTCMSLQLHIQSNQDSLILAKNDDILAYFIYYEKKEYPLDNEDQDVEKDQKDLVSKSSDNESIRDGLPRRTPQDRLLGNDLSSSLRKVMFNEQEFLANIPLSNIKYNHLRS